MKKIFSLVGVKLNKVNSTAPQCIVSIIMPCYNAEAFITDAIKSVVEQTFSNWELLVCDDGSTDLSLLRAKEFSSRNNRIKIMQNKYEKGASGARNTALDSATGRYIAFLDADDLWKPNKLSRQINFMQTNKIAFSYSYCDVIDENGDYQSTTYTPQTVSSGRLRLSNFIPCLTAIYDTEVFGKVAQPNIKKRNDFALWLVLLNQRINVRAVCFNEVTASYRSNHYGLSANKFDAIRYFYICLVRYGRTNSILALGFVAFAVVLKVMKEKSPSLYNFFIRRI